MTTEEEQLETAPVEETPEQLAERETAEAAGAEKDKPAVAVDPAEFKRVQKELKDVRRQAREHEQNAQYWAERAAKTPAAPAKAEAEPDPADEIDIVSELTTNGAKGLDRVLGKLGYAKRADVQSEINAARGDISEQSQLMQRYPDLADPESPLFLATAKIYNSLKNDMPEGKAIAWAARTAAAEMGTRQRRGPAATAEGADDPDGEGEPDERAQRIDRQAGDRGRRETRATAPTISAEEKAMVANFRRAGADITEADYMKAALKGVAIGGIPQQRGRKAA